MKTDRIIELTRLIDQRMTELEGMKTKIQAEGRHSTPEERAKADDLLKDVATFTEELKLEQRELEIRGAVSESRREPIKPNVDTRDKKQIEYPGLPPVGMRFESFGEQLRAMVSASRPGGLVDRRLVRAASGAGENAPTDGGFLVQQDFSTQLLTRAYQRSEIVSRVRKLPIGANFNGANLPAFNEVTRSTSVLGGIITYWLGEGDAKTPTHPEFRNVKLTLHKLAGAMYASDELLEDTTLLESVANEGFAEAIDLELERVILRGTGAGQPLGILNSPALITQTAETGQMAATIVYENVLKMWSCLPPSSMGNAIWVYNQQAFPQLASMYVGIGAAGQPVFMPPGGASGAQYSTIFGRPAIPVENASVLGTVGDIVLFDPNQYLLAVKGGVQTATSIHVRFLNDETTLRVVFRCDGSPAWSSTLTAKDGTNTMSPFIALATRS